MTADRHTAEQAPGKPLSGPVSASTPEVGVSGGSDPLSEPQTGAQRFQDEPKPRGPVDWARHYADQREQQPAAPGETETLKATLGRVRRLGAELFVDGATRTHRAIGRQILNALQPAEDGEESAATVAADGCTTACDGVTGIRGLLEHVGIDTTGREITVDAAPAHNDGPSVAEAAANDRRWWNGEKAGE